MPFWLGELLCKAEMARSFSAVHNTSHIILYLGAVRVSPISHNACFNCRVSHIGLSALHQSYYDGNVREDPSISVKLWAGCRLSCLCQRLAVLLMCLVLLL